MINDTFLFERMKEHLGPDHKVLMAFYGGSGGCGDIVNISVECETCGVVLFDVEPDEEEGE